MRDIDCKQITETVSNLFQEACVLIPEDVLLALEQARENEESPVARDVLDKMLKWISYNRYKALALLLAVLASGWLIGCQPKVISPLTGEKVDHLILEAQVTQAQADFTGQRAQLDTEIAAYNARVEAFTQQSEQAQEELARQYKLRENVINTLGEFAVGALAGNLNPVNAVGTVSLLVVLHYHSIMNILVRLGN